MGKEVSLLVVVAMAALLLLYHKREEDKKNTGEAVDLDVVLGEDPPVYGIHYEYFVGEKDLGGGNLQKDEPVPLAAGETHQLARLSAGMFPKRADLSQLSVEFYVMGKDGVVKQAGGRFHLGACFGRRCAFAITGDGAGGFDAVRLEEAGEGT